MIQVVGEILTSLSMEDYRGEINVILEGNRINIGFDCILTPDQIRSIDIDKKDTLMIGIDEQKKKSYISVDL